MDFSWSGVRWRRTLCSPAWTSSNRNSASARSIPAIPRPGPSPSFGSLAPRARRSQSRAGSPALAEVYNALLGPGRWVQRAGVGGTLPVRFPSKQDPGDAGWHIDGSYDVEGKWWVNVHSRGRGLLALFLFTDVGDVDAPTEILVGSHLDVPRVLAPFGSRGVFYGDVAGDLPASTFQRPRARAIGRAGDVYICHPFLVHRATWPHLGSRPRMVAQPEIGHHEPFALRAGSEVCAVERAILRGLE
jgi:hypothetical protein